MTTTINLVFLFFFYKARKNLCNIYSSCTICLMRQIARALPKPSSNIIFEHESELQNVNPCLTRIVMKLAAHAVGKQQPFL